MPKYTIYFSTAKYSLYYTRICVHIKSLKQWYIPYFSWNIEAFNQFHLCTHLPSPFWYFKIIQNKCGGTSKAYHIP